MSERNQSMAYKYYDLYGIIQIYTYSICIVIYHKKDDFRLIDLSHSGISCVFCVSTYDKQQQQQQNSNLKNKRWDWLN